MLEVTTSSRWSKASGGRLLQILVASKEETRNNTLHSINWNTKYQPHCLVQRSKTSALHLRYIFTE
jgi:hypothetical protein